MDKKTRNLALSRTLPPASVARPTSPAAVLDAFLATARSEHTKKARLADLAAL